jgi:hypothetical protein
LAAAAISSIEALPSLQLESTCKLPRISASVIRLVDFSELSFERFKPAKRDIHAFASHAGDKRLEEIAHRTAWAAAKRSFGAPA